MPLKISAFPKCYLDEIASGKLSVFDWIRMAGTLDADGLEMYEGFFASLATDYLDSLASAIHDAGFAMPMLCCSPDFTVPDESKRRFQIDHYTKMIRVARRLGGPGVVCRILTGQRYPEVSWEQGQAWVLDAIDRVLPVAREYDVILGLENHYKDGFWTYPEFAQTMDRFVSIVDSVSETKHFGVQYDPSNAMVAGDDPLVLLRRMAHRVVSMHASDRYMIPGSTLSAADEVGYSSKLLHGVTGQGLNDYPAIFSVLATHNYRGWVSIEDGMNGMEEMAQSLAFLRRLLEQYFPCENTPC